LMVNLETTFFLCIPLCGVQLHGAILRALRDRE
jgi:hypothetical protein